MIIDTHVHMPDERNPRDVRYRVGRLQTIGADACAGKEQLGFINSSDSRYKWEENDSGQEWVQSV